MNDVIVTYNKKQVLVPKEIADFLELDRKRKQAEERQDRRHLSKGILETVLACGNPHLRPTEAKALKNLLLKNLRAAMAELDERDRYLLTLRYRDELSMEAIGKILGISKTAVSKRLKKLHEMLKELSQNGKVLRQLFLRLCSGAGHKNVENIQDFCGLGCNKPGPT